MTENLLRPEDAARRLGVSPSFLAKARMSGKGPAFIKLGKRVAYDPADLVEWVNSLRRLKLADEAS